MFILYISPLSIFKVIDLKYLSTKSRVWASSRMISVNIFFSFKWAIFSYFFGCLLFLWMETGHKTWEIIFSCFPRVCFNFWRFSLCSVSVLTDISLNAKSLKTKLNKTKTLLLLFTDWFCAEILLQHSAMLFTTLPGPSLPALRPEKSQCWKFKGFQLFPEHVHGFLNSPIHTGAFDCPNFPKIFSPRLPLSSLRWSVAWLSHNLLPQASGGFSFVLTMFSINVHYFSTLNEFWIGWNRYGNLASVLQETPRQVRIYKHSNLLIKSSLFPLEPGTLVLGM